MTPRAPGSEGGLSRTAVIDARIRVARESIAGHHRFIAAREEDIVGRRRTIERWEGVIADLEREKADTPPAGPVARAGNEEGCEP